MYESAFAAFRSDGIDISRAIHRDGWAILVLKSGQITFPMRGLNRQVFVRQPFYLVVWNRYADNTQQHGSSRRKELSG